MTRTDALAAGKHVRLLRLRRTATGLRPKKSQVWYPQSEIAILAPARLVIELQLAHLAAVYRNH